MLIFEEKMQISESMVDNEGQFQENSKKKTKDSSGKI